MDEGGVNHDSGGVREPRGEVNVKEKMGVESWEKGLKTQALRRRCWSSRRALSTWRWRSERKRVDCIGYKA